MEHTNYTPSDRYRRTYLQKIGNKQILNSKEITKKRIYRFCTIALASAGLVALLSCVGCASPEARQRVSEDPRSYMSLELRKVADPAGSPYSDTHKAPLWLGIPGAFIP